MLFPLFPPPSRCLFQKVIHSKLKLLLVVIVSEMTTMIERKDIVALKQCGSEP